MFKKVVPVKKYTSLDAYVPVGKSGRKQLKTVLPDLLERYITLMELICITNEVYSWSYPWSCQ